MSEKRKVCFIITSRIHYGRSKTILEAIRDHENLELQTVVAASAILPQYGYGNLLELMEKEGFPHDEAITMTIEGGNPIAMSKTTGLGVIEFTTSLSKLKPDVVVIRGDRYEVLAAAIAAAYLNIPIAHIEGGDVTGTIDESVRHAVTKLSHLHFATNDDAVRRIRRMGEHPDYIYNFGDPALEFIHQNGHRTSLDDIARGVGASVDLTKPYIMVMQHPVTTEVGSNMAHIEETLKAIDALGIQALWFWPNTDAGTDETSKALRVYREHNPDTHIRFLKSLPTDTFIALLKGAQCLVGNSSAGIKEGSFLGVPVVNVGSRQNNRMRGPNVIDVWYEEKAIKEAVKKQIAHGPYEPSTIYFKENVGKNIADTLSSTKLYTQKQFVD